MPPVKFRPTVPSDPAWANCFAAAAAAAGLGAAGTVLPGIGFPAAAAVLVVALGGAWLIARCFGLGPTRFGAANRITLARGVLVALLAGLVAAAQPPAWLALALALPALLLDGLDGAVARRLGQASAFGARFDQELDGAFMAVLAAVAVLHGAAPVWALALGAWHYAFKLAGLAWPVLRAPLPASRRRPAVCVLQGVVLAALVLPGLTPQVATALAGLGLTAVSLSFLLDTRWLVRRAKRGASA